uniref:hypothetical protein n=1 Tax=Salmonella sp. SAL4432 TaxID=3159887 RepID=UPI00397E7C38
NYNRRSTQSKDLYWNVLTPRQWVVTGFKDTEGSWYSALHGRYNLKSSVGQSKLVNPGDWHCLQVRMKVDTKPNNGVLE